MLIHTLRHAHPHSFPAPAPAALSPLSASSATDHTPPLFHSSPHLASSPQVLMSPPCSLFHFHDQIFFKVFVSTGVSLLIISLPVCLSVLHTLLATPSFTTVKVWLVLLILQPWLPIDSKHRGSELLQRNERATNANTYVRVSLQPP